MSFENYDNIILQKSGKAYYAKCINQLLKNIEIRKSNIKVPLKL